MEPFPKFYRKIKGKVIGGVFIFQASSQTTNYTLFLIFFKKKLVWISELFEKFIIKWLSKHFDKIINSFIWDGINISTHWQVSMFNYVGHENL